MRNLKPPLLQVRHDENVALTTPKLVMTISGEHDHTGPDVQRRAQSCALSSAINTVTIDERQNGSIGTKKTSIFSVVANRFKPGGSQDGQHDWPSKTGAGYQEWKEKAP